MGKGKGPALELFVSFWGNAKKKKKHLSINPYFPPPLLPIPTLFISFRDRLNKLTMKQLLYLILLFASTESFSQEEPTPVEAKTPKPEFHVDQVEKIEFQDKEPSFPGGNQALQTFFRNNLQYPESAIKNSEAGRVFVQFTVEVDGTLSDVKIMRGVSEALDAEALRLVKKMPAWEPGESKGKKVRVRYNLPINFRLD